MFQESPTVSRDGGITGRMETKRGCQYERHAFTLVSHVCILRGACRSTVKRPERRARPPFHMPLCGFVYALILSVRERMCDLYRISDDSHMYKHLNIERRLDSWIVRVGG